MPWVWDSIRLHKPPDTQPLLDQAAVGTTALASPVAFFYFQPGQPRAASVPTNRTARAGAVPTKEIVS